MYRRALCLPAVIAVLTTAALAQPSTSKLAVADIKVGAGQKLANGDLATVLYEGRLRSGKVFDSNFGKDKDPFVFEVGGREVIRGMDLGVVGMKVGGTRKLTIPSQLGYGNETKPGIPAGSTLVFTVKLLDVVKRGEERIYDKTDLQIGKGAVAKQGSTVTVEYRGTLTNGKQFDSTYERGRPFVFKIGDETVIKAFQKGIVGMKEGGKRRLRIPPDIAFGAMRGRMVPPRSVVIYEIKLVKVRR